MATNEAKHTPEPWPVDAHKLPVRDTVVLYKQDYARAVACVNACAGIEDPCAFRVDLTIFERFRRAHPVRWKQIKGLHHRDALLSSCRFLLKLCRDEGMDVEDGPDMRIFDDAKEAVREAEKC